MHGVVLGVAGAECDEGGGPVAAGGEHGSVEVEANPGELCPVVFVVVDEEGGAGVAAEVAEAGEGGGAFGFLVDGDCDDGAGWFVEEGEADGDEVGLSAGADGGEASDGLGSEEGALAMAEGGRLHGARVAR